MFGNQFSRPMKRSHSPDSYDNHQQNNSFRGGHRGGFHGGHHSKRHRGDFKDQPQTIEDRIARLGDTGFRSNDIDFLAKEIYANVDQAKKAGDTEKINVIVAKICKCIVSFPSRVATYSTLIGLISIKHYHVSSAVINALHASYPVYLEAQKWQEALTIIHLLSHLVNCKAIRASALLSLFQMLLEITFQDNIPQARSDYYAYTVLSSIPIVASSFANENEGESEKFEKILTTIEIYLSKRSKDHLNVIRVWLSDYSTVQMDYLDSLWVQTKNFRANNWKENFLHRPYCEKEYTDLMNSELILVESPTITIPAHLPIYVYPAPRIVFRLFDDDVTEGPKSIPGSDKIERFCIENHIRNIIDEIPTDPRNCSRHLTHMYRNNELPLKHILIETILGELFALPQTKHPEILYHSLLYEFTKIFNPAKNPEDIKHNYDIILNGAVKILFENLDTMNITCFNRFVEWFSFHLNNTEYIFPWQTWADATVKPRDSPKAVFVLEVLDRCVRLSFHNKIYTLVSANLSNLMPLEVKVKYQPVFEDNPRTKELAELVKKLIVQKADGKTISESLNIQIDGVEMPEDYIFKEEKHLDKLLKLDVFTSVILEVASKSLTHLSSAIGKFRNVFKSLTRVEEGQVQLLQSIHSCLQTHPQLQVILVDKLLKADLIQAKEVCNWIFSDNMKTHHLSTYPWELLNNTISRTSRGLEKLIKTRADMNVVEPKVENVDDENKTGDGDVEMKQEDVKGELDEKIQKAQAEFEELMFKVFEMFAETLGNHIRKCEISDRSYMDNWFRWIVGRMQQVYYRQYHVMQTHYDKIKTIVDGTPSIGNAITNLNH